MVQSYVLWALLGMAGYSLMTLFVKLAERSGSATTYMVLAVSTTIVAIFAILVVGVIGFLLDYGFGKLSAWFTYAEV